MYKVYHNGKFVKQTVTRELARETALFLLEASKPGSRVVVRDKRDHYTSIYTN